ncbi:MAG: hypothetical protein GYA24_15460 [Candidatus Lokiarchaeota archaeon]|nr:hypothetical protein [Candidatus Lokiarchaeota archaeon]
MAQETIARSGANQATSSGMASLRLATRNLPNALAFLQFMLVFLPFGFCSVTGTSIPYSNEGFIAGFVLLLAGSGPSLGVIAFILMKWQRRGNGIANQASKDNRSLLMPTIAYSTAVLCILLYFIEQDGWISHLVPILVYFAGTLVSGTLAMLGLMNRRETSNVSIPGLDVAIALGIIGGLYLIPANFGLPALLLVNVMIGLAIPPLLASSHASGESTSRPTSSTGPEPVPFAWCDKFLQTGNGPRTWMGTAIMLLIAISLGNLFSAVLYMNRPFPMYALHAIVFFIAVPCSVIAFSAAFKKHETTILFIIVLACTIASMVLGDYLPGFSKNPGSLVISGVATGGALSLLFKFQETRKSSDRLKDFSGNRVLETFYYTLLAALFGLLYSLTISWEGLLREDVPGYLPARLLIGGIALAFVVIILSVLTGNSKYLRDVERGLVSKKAESMEELVGGSKNDAGKTSDPMVAAMLGGAPSKKKKEMTKAKPAKTSDPMVAAMLGGTTQQKKEVEPKPAFVAHAPATAPVQPTSTPAAPMLPDRIRKIKALLMISKQVKIDNVREALTLDAETCEIVLNTWKSMLGIDVTGEFVDFKDIEIEKILNILEAFLAEWNKP